MQAREHETHVYHVADSIPAELSLAGDMIELAVDHWGQLTRDELALCFAGVLDNLPPGEAV